MSDHPAMIVERVPCCVCGETGKVSRLIFFTRDCPVCEGSGQRPILIAENLTEGDKAWVRQAACYNPNMLPPSFADRRGFGDLVNQTIGRIW